MKKICFIPLRKNSKGIIDKNSRLFGGKPLFCWCLDTLIKTGIGDEIWIATDCETIRNIVNLKYPEVSIFHRSKKSARDESPTIEVVLEFLNLHHYSPKNWFILFQATSPFSSPKDIKLLEKQINNTQYDSILACNRLKQFRWSEEGISMDYNLKSKPRRQEYKGFLIESGAFYASKISQILSTSQLLSGRIGIIESNIQRTFDIDENIDWMIGEAYIAYQKQMNADWQP